jgi:hypothetical protein
VLTRGTAPDAVGETLGLLADACARHGALTGQDGLKIAHATLVDHFNEEFADYVLAPLDRMDIAIEALICAPEPGDPPAPAPRQPSSTERRQAAGAMLGLALADLGELGQALHGVHEADSPAGVALALATVQRALQDAADRGVTKDELETVLDTWSTATAGPRIRVDSAGPG